MKITSKEINDMAQDLEMGMKVYINPETLKYKSPPDAPLTCRALSS